MTEHGAWAEGYRKGHDDAFFDREGPENSIAANPYPVLPQHPDDCLYALHDEGTPHEYEAPAVQPIDRPGVTIHKTLAQVLGLDSNTEVEADWRKTMDEIQDANDRAWLESGGLA